jgi:hypothetical protein
MDFYTLDGAQKKAKQRGKSTCFWTPRTGLMKGTSHKWIYDSAGTIKEYSKQNQHSQRIVFNGKGKRIV